jgi:hypothetical protein
VNLGLLKKRTPIYIKILTLGLSIYDIYADSPKELENDLQATAGAVIFGLI